MTDVTHTLLLANLKRRYDRLARNYGMMISTLQTAETVLTLCSLQHQTEAFKQQRLIALDMIKITLGQAEAIQQANSFAEDVSARLEEPGQPKVPFSPAQGAIGCLAVACMMGAAAALMFGIMSWLWNDPWRFLGWLALAWGAASVLVWAALYRRSYNRKGRDS